jgi:hypothetical protein
MRAEHMAASRGGAVNGESQNGSTRYGADELTAVANLFGAAGFPGVGGRHASDEARDGALRSARRSLLARGVVTIDDDGLLQVTPPHSVLFRVALAPGVVVSAEHRMRDAAETRSYYALPDVAVEHAVAVGCVHQLEQFPSVRLMGRVRDFVELTERPETGGDEAELSVAELNAALAGEASSLPAFENLVSTSYVGCIHRGDKTLVGGELRWIDCGDSGLWLVEPSSDDPERVKVRPTSARELLGELLSYLPGGERQPAAT